MRAARVFDEIDSMRREIADASGRTVVVIAHRPALMALAEQTIAVTSWLPCWIFSGCRLTSYRRCVRTLFMPLDCALKPPMEVLAQRAQDRAMT